MNYRHRSTWMSLLWAELTWREMEWCGMLVFDVPRDTAGTALLAVPWGARYARVMR